MPHQLVVTGMHRSGTSLLANAAARAGVVMGSHLMGASRGNRHGHFEDLDFVHFHERLLESRGWNALRPPAEPLQPSADEEAAARALVAARGALPLWGFKDPRTALVLDLWHRVLPAPLFLLVYRHPVEVALSLLRRGLDVEVQLDPGAAVRAWTIYNARLLEFLHAHRDCCALWHVRAAAASLPEAFGRLGARLGLSFPAADLAAVFAPEDLRLGLWARGIDWPAVLPAAMDLYARLEEAADLPGGPAPEPWEQKGLAERDLREAAEHLLARALAGRAEPAPAAELRVDYSELRLAAARQEERIGQLVREVAAAHGEHRALAEALRRQDGEIRRLRSEVREREARWAGVETTRGFRLLGAYWRVAARGRAWLERLRRPGRSGAPDEVVAGCVTEDDPAMLGDTLRLVQSIRWFGGRLAEARLLVCGVESMDPDARIALESCGAEVRIVPRFDRRNPTANKLRFLEEALRATDGGTLLLLDCDMVVVRDPLPFFPPGALAAKIADVASVPHDAFENLFRHFDLPLPSRRHVTTLLAEPTIPYFNTGVVALPAAVARQIVPVWADYNRRILDHRERLMGSSAHHSHQASLSLALAAHPVAVAEAPVEINFPLHLTHLEPPRRLLEADPAILHYHKEVDAEGCILASPYPGAQARIEAFNRRLRQERLAAPRTGGPVSGRVPV